MGVTVQELSRGRFDQGRILGQTRVVRAISSIPHLPLMLLTGAESRRTSLLKQTSSPSSPSSPEQAAISSPQSCRTSQPPKYAHFPLYSPPLYLPPLPFLS